MRVRNGGTRLMALVGIMALILALAACSGDDGAEVVPTTAASPTTVAPTTTTTSATTTATAATTTVPAAIDAEPELVWTEQHEERLKAVVVSPNGQTVATAERAAYLHRLADGALLDVLVYRHSPDDLAFAPDGSLLGAGLAAFGVVLTSTSDGGIAAELGGDFNSRLAFSPDGAHLATGDRSGVVRVWGLADSRQVAELAAPGAGWIQALSFHPSSTLVAATDFDCILRVWEVAAQSVVFELELDVAEGSCGLTSHPFTFSPDGTLMAAAVMEDGNQLIRILTVAGVEPVMDLPVPTRVRGLDFSPDGRLLVVGSRLATTIWEVASGMLLYTLDQTFDATASDQPIAVAFTPDGGHVVVARQAGTLELWRLPGAEPLVAPEPEPCEPLPLPGDILFDTGSAELKATASVFLEDLAIEMSAAFPSATLTFVGHTDSRGAADANLQLSIDRANAVKGWFEAWAEANGVGGWSLLVDGRGDTELRVPDTDAEGSFLAEAGALNRRVEIDIQSDACGP